jgi:hypothetical protein
LDARKAGKIAKTWTQRTRWNWFVLSPESRPPIRSSPVAKPPAMTSSVARQDQRLLGSSRTC